MFRYFLLILITTQVNAFNDWTTYIESNVFLREGLDSRFSDSRYLQMPWRESLNFVIESKVTPDSAGRVEVSCYEDNLWPTHPSQTTKEYHWAAFTHYDHHKLPVNSYACLRKNPSNRFCVLAAIPLAVVMSDIFEDNCGNLYRGYWLVTYYKSDENMGTLYSRGRTAYPRPHSPYENDMVEGPTFGLKKRDFLFMGQLFKGDNVKISKELDRARKDGFIREGKLFLRTN